MRLSLERRRKLSWMAGEKKANVNGEGKREETRDEQNGTVKNTSKK